MATRPADDLRELSRANLAGPSLCAAFQATASAYADEPALLTPDGTVTMTFAELDRAAREAAAGLAALGVGRGDAVGLMLTNRAEFHVADLAAMHLGAIPFSIYHTNPAEQIVPLLDNSGARVVITEPAFREQILGAQAQRPEQLQHVLVVGEASFASLRTSGSPAFDFDAAWQQVGPDDVVTLVYTSGTTGTPKGVQHTHGTILFGLRSFDEFKAVTPRGRVCSYLPMAHIAERFISHYAMCVNGHTVTCVVDPKQLALALGNAHPTRLFGVPRIYEKLRGAVLGMAAQDPSGPLAAAIDAGLARVRAQQSGAPVPELAPEHEAVLAAVRAKLGLDQAEWVGVAAAPSPLAMLEFFPAIGVNLIEFWGMSECMFAVSNPPDAVKIGTIGFAVPGVEIDLAEDGEILVRGENLMTGYRGEPERTAEAIDADGWLHSGDIAVRGDDGYLRIVDRKKELIINSAGKNMAPTKIELAVKESCPLISQVVAIGDARQYVTALVVLDEEAATAWARANDCAEDIVAVCGDARIRDEIAAAVSAANARLARVEQIKAHRVLPVSWPPGGDELTPTMKLKRRVIDKKYAAEIEELYA